MYVGHSYLNVIEHGPPLHRLLLPYAFGATVGGLLTDIVYVRSTDMMWSNFSAWLVTVAAIILAISVLVGIFDLATRRLDYARGRKWIGAALIVTALVLGVLNTMIHTHDAWTSVMPWGLTLSTAGTIVLLIAGAIGWPHLSHHTAEA